MTASTVGIIRRGYATAVKRIRNPSVRRNIPFVLPKTTLDHSVVHDHLRSLASLGSQPSLSDLEKCLPRSHSNPNSPSYPEEYAVLLGLLLRKFSLAQLSHFARNDLGLSVIPTRRSPTKTDYARTIIEKHWNWVSLSDVEEHKRLWTIHSSVELPITPREFFFALGKDGIGLRDLSVEYDVHISPVTSSSSRVKGLLVEGVQGSLDKVTSFLQLLKRDVTETEFRLTPSILLSRSMLLRISRLAGALVDQDDPGLLRISYQESKPKPLSVAKRLAIRAASETSIQLPVYSYIPVVVSTPAPTASTSLFPHKYALFPFFTSQSPPWTLPSSSLFRVRRISEWLGIKTTEDIRRTGGLAGELGRILSPDMDEVDLRQVLSSSVNLEPSQSDIISVEALTGHVVTIAPPTARPSILPPLKGSWSLLKMSDWLHENPSILQSFVPSLSPRIFTAPPSLQEILHRLEYHCQSDSNGPNTTGVVKLEIVLPTSPTLSSTEQDSMLKCRGWRGNQSSICLMSGDRPMDVKFTVSNMKDLTPEEFPENLSKYLSDLNTHLSAENATDDAPDTPTTLTIGGINYSLHLNVNVRRSVDDIPSNVDDNAQVTSESLLDHEADQKLSSCQVTCSDIRSDYEWRRFMGHCDWLTTLSVDESTSTAFTDVNALSSEAGIDDT